MKLQVGKIVTFQEEIFIEGEKNAAIPLKLFGVAAVVKNPWSGRGFVDDLKPEIRDFGPILGKKLTNRIIELAGGGDKIEAYGKACMSGLDCEIELSSALIHTLHFGNFYRDAVKAKSYLGFTNTRGPAGCVISIPMMHKTDSGLRPYYLTQEFTIHDAPFDNEVVIAIGAATSGRAHARTGDRYQDIEEMKNEKK